MCWPSTWADMCTTLSNSLVLLSKAEPFCRHILFLSAYAGCWPFQQLCWGHIKLSKVESSVLLQTDEEIPHFPM